MQVGFPEHRPAGKEWSDLSRQGTGAEQRPRASLHDPAGLALTDVPQAMRAGAAIPKADDLRTRNHPQDHDQCPDARAARRSLALGDNREVPEGVVPRPVG
jgi:hypothetical protein